MRGRGGETRKTGRWRLARPPGKKEEQARAGGEKGTRARFLRFPWESDCRGQRSGDTDYGCYRLSAREWTLYGLQGLGGCALAAYVFYRSMAAFWVTAPLGLLYPLYKREDLKEARLRRLNLEFKDGILLLASFLSAGYSIENAVAAAGRELEPLCGRDGLMVREFTEMAEKVRLNRTVESVLLDLGERSGLEDVNNFAQVFAAAKRSGGDMVEVIGHTANVIRDKLQVQEEIYTMTASKAFEQKIMSMIPILIVVYIDLTSPGFFRSMYETAAGRIVMTACLAVYGAALVLARQILRVEI